MAGLNDQPSSELHRQLETLEATKRSASEAGREEVRETCQSGTCVGASRERIRWSEHRASGPCRSGRPATANRSIQVDNATTADIAVQVAPSSHSTPPPSPISVQPPPRLPAPANSTIRAPSFDLPPPSLDLAPRSSWDDDVSVIPLIPMFPLPPQRDISVLCSGAKLPFGSLRRRSRRFTRTENIPWCRYVPPPIPHAPTPNYATKPVHSILAQPVPAQPISSASPIVTLHDPHQLLKLAQVLQILGWSPPTW
ncbi:hypothetical protein BDZ89DRAFT_712325 [Hymenopellis radicata]|nr:hypothetical protein BDZ89DRAFT_712325 [Hymenopellis radicata]